jgi:lipopolysaccharide transport system ATP-binding protein
MSNTAIKVENLSKAYQLGQIGTGTISRDLERWFAKVRGKEDPFLKIGEVNEQDSKSSSGVVWSLRDINFEVEQGDAVGIIGRNGAGKSTLLKILSKITAPTTGKISGKGRIASLLEVGTGFHPELSGRENIFLNGAILGLRKKEITRKFDEIVDFAGIERFIDTPVKRYSSGMYVRLAFAVAAHLESEILIVDEVLAVGDAEFQKKCLGKIGQVSQGEGRTVLFVSHNMASIQKICRTGILLKNGLIASQGSIGEVVTEYLSSNVQSNAIYDMTLPENLENLEGYAYQLSIEDLNGDPVNEILVGQPWQIRVRFKLNRPIKSFIVAIAMNSATEVDLRTSWSKEMDLTEGSYEAIFREETLMFATGTYNLTLGLSSYKVAFQYLENVAAFTISDIPVMGLDQTIIYTSGTGIILNPLKIQVNKLN